MKKRTRKLKTAVLRCRVHDDIKERFVAVVEAQQESESAVLRRAILDWLNRHEEKAA